MHHRQRKYKNTICLILGFILATVVYWLPLAEAGYAGAFLAGMLFASTFTVATGIMIIVSLAAKLNPPALVLIGGLGALASDWLIFRLVKNKVVDEITPIFREIGGSHLRKMAHSKYFGWTLPVLGAVIIASPLPDELGVSLMGIGQMKTVQFLAISFISHVLGMGLVVGLRGL